MKELLQLGSWERFSGPSSGCVFVILWLPFGSEAGWVPHSVFFASGEDSVGIPLANEGVGLGPSSSGPVASRPPLADRYDSAASSTPGASPGIPHCC